ncbi:MAG: hypothetical protein K0R84_2487 [Clostridia bacterium]|jgi:uncharacterized membrane protein (UPF0127 family)|nr:hypothetical protein [Clostridia bacterium]
MLYNVSKDNLVLEKLKLADGFFSKFKGLMGAKKLNKSEGLMLLSCNSIHTCFMRFPIDVVFLNMDYEVIALKERLQPWRFVNFVKKAYITVEMPEGTIENKQVQVGDLLIMK